MRLRLLPDSPLGWTPYAWLIYLSFFLVYALARNDSAADWAIDGAALVVFLVLYFRAFWLRGAALIRIAFAIVALGLLLTPRNPGASTFFIYGAAFLGEAARPASAVRWLLVIVGSVALQAWLVPLPPTAWVPGITLALIIGGTNIHFAEVRRKDAALLKAHQQAEQLAAVAERERIARDLHDLLGHTLSVIVLKAELASKLAERHPARAAAEIRDVEQISRHALAEVRRAVHGYRGERLADELAASRSTLETAGVTLITEVEPVALPADTERTLALALREAVTNVVRHSRASRCVVRLAAHGDTVRLSVEDNGVGGELVEGAGLAGMRERLAEIDGRLERDGGRGTCLTVSAPLSPELRRLDAFERSGEFA
jgi:two-component system sensor histidine kinase DesK